MYPITEAVKALFEAEQTKVLRITGTDKNGASILITDNDVIADSFQVDRYCCNGEKLEVGTAIAAQMSLKLYNGNGKYDDIEFEGAELNVEVGIADWTQSNPTISYVPCGLFTPDVQPRRMATISLTCLDRMTKFDVAVDATALTFPATVAGLVGQACTICGVTLAQSISGLPNASVNIDALPSANGVITYRNIIQWCAGIMATNAWFDWNGQLRFTWYDNPTGYTSTPDNRYNSDLYENDLTLTGVVYTNASGIEIVEGTDDYAIDLTGNSLAGPLIATVLPAIETAVNGFAYRPFTAATINAPYLWPMDAVVFTDKDGNDHDSVLTNVAFGLNGSTALESKGMTEAINKLQAPVGMTKEQAQLMTEAMERVEENIDDSLTQQDIFNRLTDNGAAQGLVLLTGQRYVNASYIRSGTLVLGGLNNQSGTLQVLDASGNVVGVWDNIGVEIKSGAINATAPGGYVAINAEVSPQYRNALAVLYGTGTDQVLFRVDRGELSVLGGNFDHGISADSYSNVTPGHISLFGEDNAGLTLTGTAVYPGSSPGQSVTDNSTTRLWNGRIELIDRNNATWFKLNYEGMIFQGPVTFGDDCDISGALSVGDAAATRANLGAAQSLTLLSTDGIVNIIEKLQTLSSDNGQSVFYADAGGASLLTGGKVTSTYKGIVARVNATTFDMFGPVGSGTNIVTGRITVNSTTITPGSFTQYSGTAI